MKKILILITIFLLLIGCSLTDDNESSISLIATDSAASTKAGSVKMQAGVDEASLGYLDGEDTIWVSLIDNPDSFELALKMQENCYIGEDTIYISDNSHLFDFFKLVITTPEITMDDSISIPVDYNMDTINLFFSFEEGIDLNNGHVDLSIDFHSDKWMDIANMPISIDMDSIISSITCEIE